MLLADPHHGYLIKERAIAAAQLVLAADPVGGNVARAVSGDLVDGLGRARAPGRGLSRALAGEAERQSVDVGEDLHELLVVARPREPPVHFPVAQLGGRDLPHVEAESREAADE